MSFDNLHDLVREEANYLLVNSRVERHHHQIRVRIVEQEEHSLSHLMKEPLACAPSSLSYVSLKPKERLNQEFASWE